MDISQIENLSGTAWRIPAAGPMRVPAIIYGGESSFAAWTRKLRSS